MTIPDNTADPTPTGPSQPLPASPWILLDRTTAGQAASVLDRLEQWLVGGGEPEAVASCASACSMEQDDAFSVAAWVGALAARLDRRIEETDRWS